MRAQCGKALGSNPEGLAGYLQIEWHLINRIWSVKVVPQGLKPPVLLAICGTAEAVPFQNGASSRSRRVFPQPVKPYPFKVD
jgi:hypothetical protein